MQHIRLLFILCWYYDDNTQYFGFSSYSHEYQNAYSLTHSFALFGSTRTPSLTPFSPKLYPMLHFLFIHHICCFFVVVCLVCNVRFIWSISPCVCPLSTHAKSYIFRLDRSLGVFCLCILSRYLSLGSLLSDFACLALCQTPWQN